MQSTTVFSSSRQPALPPSRLLPAALLALPPARPCRPGLPMPRRPT
jgi:hypothetical protein